MHILIIPSEEYIPKNNHLEGIFQHDQALALKESNHKVGAISIKLEHSIFMLLKAIAFRLVGRKITNALKNKKWVEMFFILFAKLFNQKQYINNEIISGIQVIRIEGLYYLKPNNNNDVRAWVKYGMASFKEYLNLNGKPDIVHAHNAVNAGFLAYKIFKKYNIPYVITEHSTYYARNLISAKITNQIRRIYKTAKQLVTVSPQLGNLLINKFGEKFVDFKFIPNVLDHRFISLPINVKENSSKFVFTNIATFIERKGQKELINAFYNIFKDEKDVYLRIAGGGELEKELYKLVGNLGLFEQVKILGRISREETIRELDYCNVFVFPSHFETFGVVLIESLARGKPVIATKSGGPECIVNEQNGILVDIKNQKQLENAMLFLYENYKNFDKEEIRKASLDNYSPDSIAIKLSRLYKNAIYEI